jgi:hypothetical protein
VLERRRLEREEIEDGTSCEQLLECEVRGFTPSVVCGSEAMQRVDEAVAAAHGHCHPVRLELHVPAERAMREDQHAQERVEHRADRPHEEAHQPADPSDAQVDVRDERQHLVEAGARHDDVPSDLLGHVHPAPDGHRALREVPVLVRDDGLQLVERQHVDEAEPELEVLLRRDDEVDEREVVEDTCVDARGEEDAMRLRRPRFHGERVQEREETRLVRFEDLHGLWIHRVLDHEKAAHEEAEEEERRERDEQARKEVRSGDEAIGDPAEVPCQPEVDRDEREEPHRRDPRAALVRRGRRDERRRYAIRGRREKRGEVVLDRRVFGAHGQCT